jgi:hypothetical protein
MSQRNPGSILDLFIWPHDDIWGEWEEGIACGAANNQNRKPEPIIKPALAGQEPATISTEGILGCLHGCVWQFRSSFDFDLENLMMLIFVEFRCECHLSHRDRDAIRTWPSDRWRLLGSWLIWASAKRQEMTGPEGRDKWFIGETFFHGMVPWFCGPEESWHIPMSSDICKSLS